MFPPTDPQEVDQSKNYKCKMQMFQAERQKMSKLK